MEHKDVTTSLQENWSHQRATNDEVIVLREKVAHLELGKVQQWRFISGVITGLIASIFYFGSLSNQIKNNTETIAENAGRISEIGPQISNVINTIDEKVNSHVQQNDAH